MLLLGNNLLYLLKRQIKESVSSCLARENNTAFKKMKSGLISPLFSLLFSLFSTSLFLSPFIILVYPCLGFSSSKIRRAKDNALLVTSIGIVRSIAA